MANYNEPRMPGAIIAGALNMKFNSDARDFNDYNRELAVEKATPAWGSAVSKSYCNMKDETAMVAACFCKEVLDEVLAMCQSETYADFVISFADWVDKNHGRANAGFEDQAILFAKYARHDANIVKNFA